MDIITRAMKTLQDTETVLQSLLSEAATSGDYGSAVQIAYCARTVHELIDPAPSKRKNATRSQPWLPKKLVKTREAASRSRSLARGKRDGYPRFFRQGNDLIRIALSKREKKEYRHKVSYAVLNALAAAMASKGAEGRVFSTDEFLPIQDSADGSDVPSYQAYVGISLFKQTGLIDQHGRQGYSIPRIAIFRDAVEAVWKNLPNH
jgi:hypothetical protein